MNRLAIIILLGLNLVCCKNSENKDNSQKNDSLSVQSAAQKEIEYTCPMHPEVIRKEPGKCPECGMDLQVRS